MGDHETWVKLKTKSYFINVELNDEERCFLSCHKHGTKKKFWVPMRNWTSDLQIPHCDALPLSQNQSRKSESLRFDCCDITMVIWWLSDLCSDALPLSWNWSAGSEGPSFNSSWGLRIFSLSNIHDKTKNIFLYFFTKLKTYYLSYSFYKLNDTCLLIGSYLWSIGNKCIDDLTIEKFFFLYHITQIDSMLPWICSAVDHRRQ